MRDRPTHDTPSAKGLSEAEIAEAIGLTPGAVLDLLGADLQRGVVVRGPDGWRLSDEAELRYGSALRAMGSGPVQLRSSGASRRRAQPARA